MSFGKKVALKLKPEINGNNISEKQAWSQKLNGHFFTFTEF